MFFRLEMRVTANLAALQTPTYPIIVQVGAWPKIVAELALCSGVDLGASALTPHFMARAFLAICIVALRPLLVRILSLLYLPQLLLAMSVSAHLNTAWTFQSMLPMVTQTRLVMLPTMFSQIINAMGIYAEFASFASSRFHPLLTQTRFVMLFAMFS